MIDYHRILLNLRSYALLTMREISEQTGITETKLHRISNGTSYRLDIEEVLALTDCHYDNCLVLHNSGLMA